jgi:putative transposase
MQEVTTTAVTFPSTSHDALSELLRQGAQQMLTTAIEAEVAEWIDSQRQVVRNGYLPERSITTGIGPVKIRQPRVNDRRPGDEAEPFSSKILPPYPRKTKSLEELLPWLYLKGISTGDFNEALAALVGPACPGPRP